MVKKPAPKPKVPVFSLRLDPELRAAAEAAARADDRSLASWIKLRMRAALEMKSPAPRKPGQPRAR